MAYKFSVNNIPFTPCLAMWTFVATLVSAGWVVKSDSDGTTYAANGGQLTSGNTGANGLDNSLAWFRLQAPGVNGGTIAGQTREFVFQRAAGAAGFAKQWRVKYSASAGFIQGAPSATVTPSAADELWLQGSGTDAAPNFQQIFPTDGTYHWHVVAGGAAELYSFYAFSVLVGSNSLDSGWFLDVMQTGSYPANLDVDPAVVCMLTQQSGHPWGGQEVFGYLGGVLANASSPCKARAWLGPTGQVQGATAGFNNVGVALIPYGSTSGSVMGGTGTLGTNPWTNNDDLLPAWYMRPTGSSAPVGLKGCSTLFVFGSVLRENMLTTDVAAPGAKDKICIAGGTTSLTQCIWAAWPGVTPAI